MRPAEVPLATDWAAEEGWNPGLHDAATFAAVDEDGFLVAELDGEPVGCLSAVRWNDHFGFLGFYIVRPQHRGRGFGLALWQRGLQRLDGAVVGLDGVVSQQENYRRSGFVPAHRSLRFAGPAAGWIGEHRDHATVVDASAVPFDALVPLDTRHAPAPRPRYLRAWLDQPGARARVAVDAGDVVGLAVARPCREGWKVGPVLAGSPAVARLLVGDVLAGLDGEMAVLDVPEPNGAAVALAEQHGMRFSFETARMYRGTPAGYDLTGVFGVMSFELG